MCVFLVSVVLLSRVGRLKILTVNRLGSFAEYPTVWYVYVGPVWFVYVGPVSLQQTTRSSAQGNCSTKSLAGNVIDSSLSLSSISAVYRGGVQGQGVQVREGVGEGEGVKGEGSRGHFIHLVMYCTTTWCFAQ